jgi:hypothetical protein
MGCDIHLLVEKEVDSKWSVEEGFVADFYDKDDNYFSRSEFLSTERPVQKRNYPLFSVLAGVRSDDKANKEVLLRKYSDERFRQDVYNYLEGEVVVEEVGTATLLVSPLEVATEGKKMRHCVGGYANMCERGGYAVYHIVDVDDKEATAGYRINIINAEVGSLELSQCYSYENTKASDKCLEIAKLIASKQIAVKEGGR